MANKWVCADCGSLNGIESLRCACGYGGRVPAELVQSEAQINLDAMCGGNPLYQTMLEGARKIEGTPPPEGVSLVDYARQIAKRLNAKMASEVKAKRAGDDERAEIDDAAYKASYERDLKRGREMGYGYWPLEDLDYTTGKIREGEKRA